MIRSCHKCGCELEHYKDQKIIEFDGENGSEYRVLCPQCFELAKAFVTPAYIPEISKTQYDLLVHKIKNSSEKSIFEKFKEQVKGMKSRGLTIPEIAQAAHVTNRVIMEVLKC